MTRQRRFRIDAENGPFTVFIEGAVNSLDIDRLHRPNLFDWNGPLPMEKLEGWLRHRGLELPDDLLQFWRTTGGGVLFESETMPGPCGDPELGDDVDSVNRFHHDRGLNARYFVVHFGVALTAIRLDDKMWVVLEEESYHELEEYESLSAWYTHVLRAEFAERYGLESRI